MTQSDIIKVLETARANAVNANNTVQYLRTTVIDLTDTVRRQSEQIVSLSGALSALAERLAQVEERLG
jgi:ABC-type transporter Mla subunit MlaD